MAASNRNSRALAGALALSWLAAGAGAGAGAAEVPRPTDEFNWGADVVTSDFRSDTLEFSGNVRVTQGPMSIQADAAKANDVRSPNSRWSFQKSEIGRASCRERVEIAEVGGLSENQLEAA